jgi:hypothetical protein
MGFVAPWAIEDGLKKTLEMEFTGKAPAGVAQR